MRHAKGGSKVTTFLFRCSYI